MCICIKTRVSGPISFISMGRKTLHNGMYRSEYIRFFFFCVKRKLVFCAINTDMGKIEVLLEWALYHSIHTLRKRFN